jgi:hypothetical protein
LSRHPTLHPLSDLKKLEKPIIDEIDHWAKEKSSLADEKEALADKEKLHQLQNEYIELTEKSLQKDR